MSEHLWKFFLNELATVRLVCQAQQGSAPCGAAVEVTLDHILHRNGPITCQACGNFLRAPRAMGGGDYLTIFAEAVKGLQAAGLQIEFITQAKRPYAP
jgi:hypothetical protein